MFSLPEHIKKVKVYEPGKPEEELKRELGLKEIVKLASNENPLGPCPMAVRAIVEDLKNLHRYPDGNSYYLKKKLSEKLSVRPENIFLGLGSNEALDTISRAYLRPGLNAVYSEKSFAVYPIIVQLSGAEHRVVKMKDNYYVDLKAHLDAIDENTAVVFIANPNNPTGTAFSKSEFEDFLKNFPDDVLLVLDEAYYEYAVGSGFPVPNGMDYIYEKNVVVTRTFSKIYGLAGLRLGYAVAKEEIIEDMNRIRQPFNVTRPAQVGGAAALDDKMFVKHSQVVNEEGKRYLYKEFEKLGLEYVPTCANFILVNVGFPSREVFSRLLRKGVIVRAMDGYGFPTHIRVTVGTMRENIYFINKLTEVLEELRDEAV
ncbi:histidinol-phosphate transaminase [Thermovibrio sp.]